MLNRLGVVIVVTCACGGGGRSPFDAPIPEDPRKPVAFSYATVNRNIDLLFVVDDSSSMAGKQQALATSFPAFINSINLIEGGLPDLHIGVVSTDMGTKPVNGVPGPGIGTVGQGGCANTGDDGKLQTSGAQITGTFISDIKQTDGTRLKNYTGSLETVFSQMARLGATGCGFEQPLHAMQRSLQNTTANPGFLRPDAKLGVIFLADEDDCSIRSTTLLGPEGAELGPLVSFRCTRFGVRCEVGGQTPDEMNTVGEKINCSSNPTSPHVEDIAGFAATLKALKQRPDQDIFVGALIGDPTPIAVEMRSINGTAPQPALAHSCSFQAPAGMEVADPGLRIKRFLDQFTHSQFSTVCSPDLSAGLSLIAEKARPVLGDPCIRATLAQPLDCIAQDQNGATIEPCGSPPCWKIVSDPMKCLAGQQMFVIDRTSPPPPDTRVTLRCRLAS